MAQKMQVLLTCDLEDGEKPATQTLQFAINGSSYEIDLCDKHANKMRGDLATFVAAARKVSRAVGSNRRRRSSSGGSDRDRTQAIRAWAKSNGITVSERGRLSSEIVALHEAAAKR